MVPYIITPAWFLWFMCPFHSFSVVSCPSLSFHSPSLFFHLYCLLLLQWQELVQGFRRGMPRQRRRVGRRLHEECFTGSEAVEWMHDYLQSSGQFGAVSRQQVCTAMYLASLATIILFCTCMNCNLQQPRLCIGWATFCDSFNVHVHVCQRADFLTYVRTCTCTYIAILVCYTQYGPLSCISLIHRPTLSTNLSHYW